VEIYKAVPFQGVLLGGHWAIERASGTKFGADFHLDQARAERLARELNVAYMKGRLDERALALK
jgi:hypothetical protein